MVQKPGVCPPGQSNYDVSSAPDCLTQLTLIYNAYVAAIAGKTRVVVRLNDRWSEYSRPQAAELLTLYQTLYAQCPQAPLVGLPDLNPNLKVERGRPARGFFRW